MKLSKWVVNLEKAFFSEMSDAFDFYKKYRATRRCPAVIATAQDSILMPKEDFNALLNILKNRDKTAQLTNSGSVVSEMDCS